jgi:hypothetical protein
VRVSISISRGGKFTFSDASTAGQNNNAMCTELRGHSPFQDHPSDINRTLWANVTFLQPVQHIFLGPNLVSESIDRRIGRFFSPLPPRPSLFVGLKLLVKRRASASVLNPPNGPRNRTRVNCTECYFLPSRCLCWLCAWVTVLSMVLTSNCH